jgi:hypothetical protein
MSTCSGSSRIRIVFIVGGPVGRGVGPVARAFLAGGPSFEGEGMRSGRGLPSGNGAELTVSWSEESVAVFVRRRLGSLSALTSDGSRNDVDRGESIESALLDVDEPAEVDASGSSRTRTNDLHCQ